MLQERQCFTRIRDFRPLRHRVSEGLFTCQIALPSLSCGQRMTLLETGVHHWAGVTDDAMAEVVVEYLDPFQNWQEGRGFVPAAFNIHDGNSRRGLCKFADGGFVERLENAVLKIDLPAHAQR